MWWFDIRVCLAAISSVFLASCGFTPVYGPGGAAAALEGRVRIAEPDSRAEFALARRLEERLGRAASPDLRLAVALDIEEEPAAFTTEREITRYTLEGTATYTLRDGQDRVVDRGSVATFTGYSATGSTIATLTAEEDARDRLSVALADLIVARLIAAAPDS